VFLVGYCREDIEGRSVHMLHCEFELSDFTLFKLLWASYASTIPGIVPKENL
jgi:hypothetical protein